MSIRPCFSCLQWNAPTFSPMRYLSGPRSNESGLVTFCAHTSKRFRAIYVKMRWRIGCSGNQLINRIIQSQEKAMIFNKLILF